MSAHRVVSCRQVGHDNHVCQQLGQDPSHGVRRLDDLNGPDGTFGERPLRRAVTARGGDQQTCSATGLRVEQLEGGDRCVEVGHYERVRHATQRAGHRGLEARPHRDQRGEGADDLAQPSPSVQHGPGAVAAFESQPQGLVAGCMRRSVAFGVPLLLPEGGDVHLCGGERLRRPSRTRCPDRPRRHPCRRPGSPRP